MKKLNRIEVFESLKSAGKKNDEALPYTIYINRPLSNYVVYWAYRNNITPNELTYLGFLFTSIGILFLLFEFSYIFTILGVLWLLIGYVFDSADGRLSRFTGKSTPFGEWLDHSLDLVKIIATHFLIIYLLSKSDNNVSMIIAIGFFSILSIVGQFFTTLIRDKLVRISGKNFTELIRERSKTALLIRAVVLSPFDYGVFCLIFLLSVNSDLFVLIYFIYALFSFVKFIFSFVRSKSILHNL